jgi:hypothetical protein
MFSAVPMDKSYSFSDAAALHAAIYTEIPHLNFTIGVILHKLHRLCKDMFSPIA